MGIVQYNEKIHDKISSKYDNNHTEIYNEIEQDRIKSIVEYIYNLFENKNHISFLDFGAGTGNLSKNFLEKGFDVTSLDISEKSLEQIKNKFNQKINIKHFDGIDIPFGDNSFDVVGTYSVLHHIPDYIYAVKEMCRVVKKGGIIYIDHETSPNKWNDNNKLLNEYYSFKKENLKNKFKRLFLRLEIISYTKWKAFFIQKFINHKFQEEGDIHVWKDDHIEWDKIKNILSEYDFEILNEEDYLLYDSKIDYNTYIKYKDKTDDTKLLIAIKK